MVCTQAARCSHVAACGEERFANQCLRYTLRLKPLDGQPAERWEVVGVMRGVQKSGLNGPCFYLYLWFGSSEDDQAEMLAMVWLGFPAKRLRDEVYDQIRRKNPRCGIERDDKDQYWDLVLSTPFTADSPATGPEDTLDKVLSDWIGCCESIDGLKLSGR